MIVGLLASTKIQQYKETIEIWTKIYFVCKRMLTPFFRDSPERVRPTTISWLLAIMEVKALFDTASPIIHVAVSFFFLLNPFF